MNCPNVECEMGSSKLEALEAKKKNHLVFAVNDSFDYVNHEEEAPFAGELELTCG